MKALTLTRNLFFLPSFMLHATKIQTWLEHGATADSTSVDGGETDFDVIPRRLSRTLCETGDACRLGLSEENLLQIDSLSTVENAGVNTNSVGNMSKIKRHHTRVARWLNAEERSWDVVYRSMDSYVQRIGTNEKASVPCEEYTLLQERGHQLLLTFKRNSTRF